MENSRGRIFRKLLDVMFDFWFMMWQLFSRITKANLLSQSRPKIREVLNPPTSPSKTSPLGTPLIWKMIHNTTFLIYFQSPLNYSKSSKLKSCHIVSASDFLETGKKCDESNRNSFILLPGALFFHHAETVMMGCVYIEKEKLLCEFFSEGRNQGFPQHIFQK